MLKEQLRSREATGAAADFAGMLHLGQALHAAGEREAALHAFECAADLGPDSVEAWGAVATLRFELGLLQGALRACESALRLSPNDAMALFNTGVVLAALDDLPAALHCYQRVLEIAPEHAGALLNLGPLLARTGRIPEAVAACDIALKRDPGNAALHFNRGDVLLGAAEFSRALDDFEAALALSPGNAKAEFSAGVALSALGDLTLARQRMNRALTLDPELLSGYVSPLRTDSISAYPELSPERIFIFSRYDRLRSCDWNDYAAFARRFGELVCGEGGVAIDNPDFAYISLGIPVADECRRSLARSVARRIRSPLGRGNFVRPHRTGNARLRIGYLSGDLRAHAVAYLIGGLFELHDRNRFEVYAYSTGPDDGSRERRRAEAGADVFRDVSAFSGVVIGQAIAMDGIDILVDLSGYTLYGRPEAMALRPAPVQVAYLGFMGTQGAPWIDYTLLDRVTLNAETRPYWDEKIAYLPSFFSLCEKPDLSGDIPSRQAAGLPEEAFVLNALHMPRKIDPASFALWLQVLEAIPNAVLWLLAETPQVERNLRAAAEAAGGLASRLVFAPMVPRGANLARYRLADLFLDSLSYNGHTTVADTLAAGVPALTMRGTDVVARVSESMLRLCGLQALVADDRAGFVALAARFASDRDWRSDILTTLQHGQSRLFDNEGRVREMERAYEKMWERHRAGLPPEDFDVSPLG